MSATFRIISSLLGESKSVILDLSVFFLYIILFNVPIIFILASHHMTLNESVEQVDRITECFEARQTEEFQEAI